MGMEISIEKMCSYIQEALDKRLEMARCKPQTLMLQVQIANKLVVQVLSYMLTCGLASSHS